LNTEELSRHVAGRIPDLFLCSPAPGGRVRVETPLVYPDGGIVDVFVFERAGRFYVTDFGEAFAWLGLRSGKPKPTPGQERAIRAVCQTLQISERRGQLELAVANAREVGDAVLRLAQAVVQIAEIPLTAKVRRPKIVGEEVEEWFATQNVPFERGVRLDGFSGEKWTVDYRTLVRDSTSFVFLLSTDSKSAARQRAEHVVAGCFDLNHDKRAHERLSLVSLFDDSGDIWEEHIRLVQPLSQVARWSRRDRFAEMLGVR